MAKIAYNEFTSPKIGQELSIPNQVGGTKTQIWLVPEGFYGRLRLLHYIIDVDTTNATFRGVFINVISGAGKDAGQIIPGIGAFGGGAPPTNNPVHELLDATSPVFFDEVFNGAAGVQPQWDYSGMTDVWYPGGWSFELDISQLLGTERVRDFVALVEIIEAVDPGLSGSQERAIEGAEAWLLHSG